MTVMDKETKVCLKLSYVLEDCLHLDDPFFCLSGDYPFYTIDIIDMCYDKKFLKNRNLFIKGISV